MITLYLMGVVAAFAIGYGSLKSAAEHRRKANALWCILGFSLFSWIAAVVFLFVIYENKT